MILPMTGSLSGQVFSSGMPVHKALSDPETAVVAAAAELDLGPVLAEARAEQQRVAMLDERDRIAADLHDHVIQRLFAAGLSLQSTAATLGPGAPTTRILATVDDLDDTIRQIRTSIFQLQQVQPRTVGGLRVRLLDVAAELTAVLGFAPALRLSALLRHPARRSGRGRRGGCAGVADQCGPARTGRFCRGGRDRRREPADRRGA
jgi:signal transduction histidine kinase